MYISQQRYKTEGDILTYKNICDGIFHRRPNRFIAEVEINGQIELCHIKNTGRCKELLVPGTSVYVNQSANPNRATKYDLVSVYKNETLINIDSQAPNQIFREYLQAGNYFDSITLIKPESKFGGSRFDFYVEAFNRKAFIEVKGVTLEHNGVALFPDAPTERGIKHLNELVDCIQDGYEAHVVFLVQMKGIRSFSPNNKIHPEFSATLIKASNAGVHVNAFDCIVTPDSLNIGCPVPVNFNYSM